MPDLLAHALVAYAVCTLLSWRYEWLTGPYVTVGMVGAFLPDLAKVNLLVPALDVREALSIPFSWTPLHTVGGLVATVTIGVVLVGQGERRRVAALLGVGAVTHLVADSFLRTPTGSITPLFWPLSTRPPPTQGLYLSTDPWPTLVAAGVAAAITVATRRRTDTERSGERPD